MCECVLSPLLLLLDDGFGMREPDEAENQILSWDARSREAIIAHRISGEVS